MDLLILGGTRFVGRHIVLAALARGHRVTTFTRGHSPDELPAEVERLHGDRTADLSALAGRRWDACVDVSGYLPRVVRASAEALRDAVGRYLFISTLSVYEASGVGPLTEDSALIELADPESEDIQAHYGGLKVLCERAVEEVYGARATILRPDIVAGPFDPTGRYTYWPLRLARGGAVLAPGDGQDPVQYVDARDLAAFALQLLEADQGGTYNAAGPVFTWRDFLAAVGRGVGASADLHWREAGLLEARGIGWNELPLYIPRTSEAASLMNAANERALAAGFTPRPSEETAREVLDWAKGQPLKEGQLSPEQEAQLLAGT